MSFHVPYHVPPKGKSLSAQWTLMWLNFFVSRLMLLQVTFVFEAATAGWTFKRFLPIVTSHMASQCRTVHKGSLALATPVRSLPSVNSCVHLRMERRKMMMMMIMMMVMMMVMVCARNTNGTNTYRYLFRRYSFRASSSSSSSSLPFSLFQVFQNFPTWPKSTKSILM